MDRLLRHLHAAHDLRHTIRGLDDRERDAMAQILGNRLASNWVFTAREAQLPPRDLNWCWLFIGGRGAGKTRALSCTVHMAVTAGIRRIHFVAPTTGDIHAVNVEGPAGILATHGEAGRPHWVPSKRRLEWPNGAICSFFSGEEPESLRGPQAELALIDELARMQYQQAAFDMTMMGLRLGEKPRLMIATTPRPTRLMKRLVSMDGISITTSSTFDNAANLAPSFISKIRDLYEGTRLGRQELYGAMLLDPPNALFKDEWLIHHDVPEDLIEQVTVGVDPSGGSDRTGIVVAALLTDGRLAILADRTSDGSPARWGDEVVRAHDEFNADDVVVELNFGGAMATEVVKQAADRAQQAGRRADNYIRIKEVTASRGKAMRAEPISLLYEKGRILHRRGLTELEAEMLSFSPEWNRAVDGSPNRLDAAVWSLTRLSRVVTDIPMA
jgi:phage terminase large subunit-like protein